MLWLLEVKYKWLDILLVLQEILLKVVALNISYVPFIFFCDAVFVEILIQ